MKRAGKVLAIVAGVLAGLIVLILTVISLVLTPERLTEWTRTYGTEYLVGGRVDVGQVDLTVWSSFPHAELRIDSLRVENYAVPEEYRTVVDIERFSGRVNLAALLIGRISVGHAEILRPKVTLWTGADSAQSSLSILPASEPQSPDDAKNKPLTIPDIRITNFLVGGDAELRYVSVRDSIDAALTLHRVNLDGRDETPQYHLLTNASAAAFSLLATPLTIALDGGIGWNPSEPLRISLHDFFIGVDKIATRTSLMADFTDGIHFDALDFKLSPLPLQRLTELADSIPALAGKIPLIKTDAAITLSAKLLKPYDYVPDTLLLPDMTVEAALGDASVDIPAYYLSLTNLGAEVRADISSAGPDAGRVELKRLHVAFPATEFTLKGSVTNPGTDPAIDGCFKGKVNFTNLNPRMWTLLGMRLGGSMDADIDVVGHLSDFSVNTFHRIRIDGEASLRNFTALLPTDTIAAGLTRGNISFGPSDRYPGVDSLLMATVTIDSLWAELPELHVRAKDFRLDAGVSNTSTTLDSTTVTPMGGLLAVKSLTYKSKSDSVRARIRDLSGGVQLSRYKGQKRAPALSVKLTARRMVYADGVNRASLGGLDIAATSHALPRRSRKRRQLSRADSLRIAANRDSILLANSKFEQLDLGIDRTSITMLRRLNVSGHVRARSGRVMTPLFPLRTRLKGLDMTFNADSVMLKALQISAGRSDVSLSGSITNMQRALGRTNASAPLRLALKVTSDTIDVNELTQAAFRGAAFAAKADTLNRVGTVSLDAADEVVEAQASESASTETMAPVVPMNVDATLNVSARNIIYSTLALKDMRGEILVANGAAHLRDLHAVTDIGSADLNMLYYAPTRQDVNFGVGLDLRRFNIGRVTELMPALDSIMPILSTLGGIIDVDVSATTPVDSVMNIKMSELSAMVHLSGDSLRVLDEKTFKTISKWLLFHDKKKNMIDHMDVHLTVDDNRLSLYPFMFDFDRYRIGVMGNNDLALNLNYHVSILRSPIPFKFGINVKGSVDKMKIRLGRARFKENMAAETRELSDTVRLNLAQEIRNVFSRGAGVARLGHLNVRRPPALDSIAESADTLTAADSLYFRQQGLLDSIPNMKEL